jgi:hypothetical protein
MNETQDVEKMSDVSGELQSSSSSESMERVNQFKEDERNSFKDPYSHDIAKPFKKSIEQLLKSDP